MKSRNQLAYTAGIIDGEGCISIQKSTGLKHRRNFFLSVRVTNTNEWLVNWLKMQYGGCIVFRPNHDGIAKDSWQWSLGGPKAAEMLEYIKPYLMIKRPQADLALAFQHKKRDMIFKRQAPLSDSDLVLREADYLLMHHMNRRGKEVET